MEKSIEDGGISGGARKSIRGDGVDVLFVAPHYLKNASSGTYDGVSKYSSELITAIGSSQRSWRTGVSNFSSTAAYYLDAGLGFPLLRGEMAWRRPRLVHTLDWYLPVVSKDIPHIATVHDLIMLEWNKGLRRWKSRLFLQGLRSADHYIAISHRVAEALRSQLGIGEDRISVVHHGVSPAFLGGEAGEVATKTIDILFVSNIAHRKNIGTLLRAVERLRSEGEDVCVTIVGRILEEEGPVLEKLQGLQRVGAVRICSGLSEIELADTYARARVFVSSSTAEGFGMPVLEAMASGVPLLLSDIPIYRELADGCASFFSPLDDAALANQLLPLLKDSGRRVEEGERNRREGQRFSWGRCAEETLNVYTKLL